ncbi:olfactory receptor 5M11-like [Gastrophryne carolinensis]
MSAHDLLYRSPIMPGQIHLNLTKNKYFIIQGISDVPEIKTTVFIFVLLDYLLTLIGNLTILLLVCLDSQLHTPMYFFLANLSIVDMSCTTTALLKILTSFVTGDKTISFAGCLAQMYLYGSLLLNELYILTAMSYDRYIAICLPLIYHLIMNRRKCIILASFCWVSAFLLIGSLAGILFTFSCYSSIEINHFLCDFISLMKITCSDTKLLDIVFFLVASCFFTLAPFLLTFIPYVFIIVAVLKIRTDTGRLKAFYTCSSHLTVVTLLYIILVCQYLIPSSANTFNSRKVYSLVNTAVMPLLNPIIYSFKNKDVNAALKKRFNKCQMIS